MSIKGWVRRVVLGMPADPGQQFSAGPMPLDRMFADMRGATGSIGRDKALTIPGVLRGRNLLCSVATLPLVERGPANVIVRAPLLEQIDPNVPNVVVLAATLEDLMFEGKAWWRVTARGADRYPTSARRVDVGRVSMHPPKGWAAPHPETQAGREADRVVWVDGERVPAGDMIRYDSPNPGLLQYAGNTLRLAAEYQHAAAMYARNPQTSEHFTPADNMDELDDDAIREHLSQWRAARRAGGTGYVPRALKYNPGDPVSAADQKLVELKAQAALETALCMGLDPEVLGVSTTSRTYANATDWRRDRINDMFAAYMLAITQRLSMADLCRRGYVRTFDLDDYLRADPITRWTVYGQATAMGAMTVEHVQQEEGLPVTGPVAAPTGGQPAVTPGTTGQPVDEVAARRNRAASFAGPAARTFEFATTVATFNVDTASRTVSGIALPYNEIASKYGLKFRFAKGSIEYNTDAIGRVKFLKDHDYGQALGVATAITDGDDGLKTAFRVGAGEDRDAILADAADGILDGLSVGVEFDDDDMIADPDNKGVYLVQRATLREVSLTAMPAFDSARVTKVAASRDNGGPMHTCSTCGHQMTPGVAHVCSAPAGPVTLTAEQFTQLLNRGAVEPADPGPAVIDPAGPDAPGGAVFVAEPLPYAFNRARPGRAAHFVVSEHDFSTDVAAMLKSRDTYGQLTDEGKRVMGFVRAMFDVDSTDANETHPTIQRPDMYVDQRDYKYPLWNAVNKGAPPNGIQPFTFPKFNAASGLVGDHTEGVEPTGGTITTTGQTVTPTALSGKAYMTREVYDMGGNPAVSTLIWNQMVRGYREGLESATATFLNTLTAATDITLTAGAVDDALADAWEAAVAALQFTRGYDFEMFAVEQALYLRFAAAEDSTGRPLFPMINPMNTNGQSRTRFRTLDLAGVEGIPSWALPSTPGSPNNSWLFDPTTVHGWATGPQRLDFEGAADDNTTVAPVAKIGIGIWGYKAFANSDIGGVRQVIYDTVA